MTLQNILCLLIHCFLHWSITKHYVVHLFMTQNESVWFTKHQKKCPRKCLAIIDALCKI